MTKRTAGIILALTACLTLSPLSYAQEQTAAYHDPATEEDESLSCKMKTTWDCVYFGSYPTSEVTDKEFSAVADYAVRDDNVVVDPALYEALEAAEWTGNETELDGVRYRRLKGEDAEGGGEVREQHYVWEDTDTWHYFRYEPIKWRVLEMNGDEAMLLCDREMDCAPFHVQAEDVCWEDCTLRSFLNGYDESQNSAGISYAGNPEDSFLNTAFSEEEQAGILTSEVDAPANSYYGTPCGDPSRDKVFLLSVDDVFSGESAGRHGFYVGHGVDDPARRFHPTMYAMARGTWYSPVEAYKGNGFWFMRTNGYTQSNVTYICDFGYIYNRGTFVTCNDAGILPAIRVDLAKAALVDAGTVSSDGTQTAPEGPGTGLSDPRYVPDENMPGGNEVIWDTVHFGSYPMTEVTDGSFTGVDEYALLDGDVIIDEELYAALAQAEWENNEAEIDGVMYRRMKASDAVSWSSSRAQHYAWDSEDAYHYFRYEPITWRVIESNGNAVTLMADRLLDCAPFNTEAEEVYWESCTLRSFLNGYDETANREGINYGQKPQDSFFNSAFSEEEKACVLTDTVENPANYYFGTSCGQDTVDQVYIPDEEEVFSTPDAARHGFYESDGLNDPARRFRPTLYAMARGAWYSPLDENKGNGFWFLRTSGYTPSNVNYICDFGYVFNRGTYVTCNDSGVLPLIRVDAVKAGLEKAGTVSSKDIMK